MSYLSILKSPAMIKTIPEDFSINFNGSNFFSFKQVKNLSVTFDQTISFKPHVDKICSRATYALLKINRVEHLLNKATRQIAVTSVALSHMNYCTTIWSFCSKSTLMKAERCQKFFHQDNKQWPPQEIR